MGRPSPKPPEPPPLVAWSGTRLVVFAVLLPLAGIALLALLGVSLATGIGGVWRPDDVLGSVFVVGWLLVLGLGLTGFTAVVVGELRRRRRFPSAEEQRARQVTAEEDARERLEHVRWWVRAGAAWAALGVPGLVACVGHKWHGHDPPGWATVLLLPLAAAAPLCWMHAAKIGLALWAARRGASRWLAYAAAGLAAYFVLLVLVVFPFLRR